MSGQFPDCPHEMPSACRFVGEGRFSTCMHSPIEYDRDGKPVGGGRNTVSDAKFCTTCGQRYVRSGTELEAAQGKLVWRAANVA